MVPITCEAGSYAAAQSEVCNRCPGGDYSASSGASSCDGCPAGTRCSEGATTPISCSSGTFTATAQQSSCGKCAAGTFQEAEGATACVSCIRGAACIRGASASLPCAEGSYSAATDLATPAQCTRTDPGFFAPTGSAEQTPCAAGTVASTGGLGSCRLCVKGSYQNETGAQECRSCMAGSYSSINGAAECNNCLSRLSSYPGSTSCNVCDEHHYRRDAQTVATPAECGLCPTKGVACPLDTILETIVILPGYWRLSSWSREILSCGNAPSFERCVGGVNASSANSSVVGDGYCGDLFTGAADAT